MADTPKAVKVEALKDHTYNGKAYKVGDTYDFVPVDNPAGISADAQVESLANTGFAIRVDRVAHAKAIAKAAEESQEAQRKASKTAVEPMTTTSRGARALAKPRKAKK